MKDVVGKFFVWTGKRPHTILVGIYYYSSFLDFSDPGQVHPLYHKNLGQSSKRRFRDA